MLTKEDAQILCNKLQAKVFQNHGWSGNMILEVINEFTEKPKRQIHADDIYRDKEGFIREIETLHTGSAYSRCGYEYDYYGKYMGTCDKTDLDTSKKYKLVEIDDAD